MPIRDILQNNVKEKLKRDEVVASMTVRLIRTVEIARIARTAGFDTLYVDIEHSSFSLDTCGQICMAALEAGIAPFVRVPANTPDYVSRVLDGGALGVIAPHIRSADEAKAVVSAAKFPPQGERSNAGGLPHLHFRSFPAAEACAALNDATMVVVQFESAAALDRAEEIVAVDGVDMVLLGLNDLLADWGIPGEYDHRGLPQARQALRRRRARHASRSGGRVREDGRALRLDRHRPRLPVERLRRARTTGQGDQALMSAPPALEAARLYVEAGAADAFARRLLRAHGVPEHDAATVAACLVGADLRGVDTHGLCRLPGYLDRLRRGLINPRPVLEPERVTPVAAALDGQNGFGFVVGTRAMQEAIAIARELGVGVVSARRSTHFGMAAAGARRGIDLARVQQRVPGHAALGCAHGAARHQSIRGRRARGPPPSLPS